ncbi:MAG: polysaccharide biosynthesis C-terminal domain-containing protein, partial [Muribaculaceae bacterium]|nr:polysaccharide biosynthesis C-terminal domain-containing protein [Muribaculaceae bacterium]
MMNDKQERLYELAHAPLGRLLWKYSLPSIVGMLVMALYNVVDRIFIGQVVGPEAIAGMTITFPIMNITTAIGVLVGVGASARISIAMGEGNSTLAARILGNAATLTIINGAAYIALITWQLAPLLRMFGAGDITLPYAYSYMIWVLPGLLLTNITFGLNNVLRATGYPIKAMFTMLIGAVANVILDAILVLWLGNGMVGAAIATDISMAVSGWFVVAHFLKRNVSLRFERGTFKLCGG